MRILIRDSLAVKVIPDLTKPDGVFPEPVSKKLSLKSLKKWAGGLASKYAPAILKDLKNSMPPGQADAFELKQALLKFRSALTKEQIR